MERGRNSSGRGRGRRGGRRGNFEGQGRGQGRGEGNQGGGRGWSGSGSGPQQQPPSSPQGEDRPANEDGGRGWSGSGRGPQQQPPPPPQGEDRPANEGGGRGWSGSGRGPQQQPPPPPQGEDRPANQGGGKGWSGSGRGPQQQPPPPPQGEDRPANEGGGRGWSGSGRGPQQQPPPSPQGEHRPVWGNRPTQEAATQQPSSGRGPAWTGRPCWPSLPTATGQPAPYMAAVQRGFQSVKISDKSSSSTGRPWGPSSSTATVQPTTPPAAVKPGVQSVKISDKPSSSSSPQSKEGQVQAMTRPGVGTLAVEKINIDVNHFRVKFEKDRTIFHYDVDVKYNSGKQRMGKFVTRFIRKKALPEDHQLKSVYDGEKNIFSAVPLEEREYEVNVLEGEVIRSGLYTFTIKLVNELKLSKLQDYLNGTLPAVPRDTLQGLDLVMKDNPFRTTITFGNRSFFVKRGEANIGRGLQAFKGFQQSLKPTGQGLALCLDYSVIAFGKQLPVINFLFEHFPNLKRVNDVVKMREDISMALKGLKVMVTHRTTNQRYTILGLTDKLTREIEFDKNDRAGGAPPEKIRLVEYFSKTHKKVIEYQEIPCLDLGKPNRPNAVPMEFCELVSHQRFRMEGLDWDTASRLKNLTLVNPSDRYKRINEMVRAPDGPSGDVAKNFDLVLVKKMTEVVGRIIGAPELNLGGGDGHPLRLKTPKCHWNLASRSFVGAKPLHSWAFLDLTKDDDSKYWNSDIFIEQLRRRCQRLGIQINPPVVHHLTGMDALDSSERLANLFKMLMKESIRVHKQKLQMVVCAMTRRHPGYKYLKWFSEVKMGVVTQCLLSSIPGGKGQDQYLANLCLKINAKLGGSNFEVTWSLPDHFDLVMFIGADVNHPGPMNTESPSIAAVVGTMNWPAANRYAARISPQKHRCETILKFGDMCKQLVTAYSGLNKEVRPERIVVFRDGVSDGQFEMVLDQEVRDLKKSISTHGYEPKITVIVAQKRHQTRLFQRFAISENVPPGTVVDTVIVSPRDFDFYLCSHDGAMGTSKPTHYYVLQDENRFTSNQLQKLIYDMCFTFVRCTKPVSLVPPVFYADLVAYRGRMFQEVVFGMHPPSAAALTPSFDQDFYNLHSDLENTMFFV